MAPCPDSYPGRRELRPDSQHEQSEGILPGVENWELSGREKPSLHMHIHTSVGEQRRKNATRKQHIKETKGREKPEVLLCPAIIQQMEHAQEKSRTNNHGRDSRYVIVLQKP